MNRNYLLPMVVIGFLLLMLAMPGGGGGGGGMPTQVPEHPAAVRMVPYSTFMDRVEAGEVTRVVVSRDEVNGRGQDGRWLRAYTPPYADVTERLEGTGAVIEAERSGDGGIGSILLAWLPMLLFIGVFIWFMRKQTGAASGMASKFGQSRAKTLSEDSRKATFSDVAGVDEAKQELEEVVDFLRQPDRYARLGGQIPKGVLLAGSPGTGKTLLARAVAGEAGVPFFTVSGSSFIEMFVGVGASRVRDMFEQARKNAPCIVFIDELDALGRKRGAGLGGGNDEREQTLNQLLVEMDGFDAQAGVIIIAATNRPDILDPALTRPGRFDRQVTVPAPDVVGREQILKVHAAKVPLAADVRLRDQARATPGFSGADLQNLVNEAALIAARAGARMVSRLHFEQARDKILMGAERRSILLGEDERRLTAYHEAGHAILGLYVEGNDPLHKVTIIPRGRAMGVTMNLPEKDRYGYTIKEVTARLAMMFGGRAAEELIFGRDNVTTGAGNDIKQATGLARRMVTEWGMSEAVGPMDLAESDNQVFLGEQIVQSGSVSESTRQLVDAEVKRLLSESEETAKRVLRERMTELHRLAAALLSYETLSAEETRRAIAGEDVRGPGDGPGNAGTPARPARGSVPTSGARAGAAQPGTA